MAANVVDAEGSGAVRDMITAKILSDTHLLAIVYAGQRPGDINSLTSMSRDFGGARHCLPRLFFACQTRQQVWTCLGGVFAYAFHNGVILVGCHRVLRRLRVREETVNT
jgi:hypothetical protein